MSLAPSSASAHPQWRSLCIPPCLQPPLLTLQLFVTSLPLKADGVCPVMDEALEAGISALLHGAAGRVDGDDRAAKAWG